MFISENFFEIKNFVCITISFILVHSYINVDKDNKFNFQHK
jgi:hypothetical protein